jgi:predicted ATP-grasp superfamily ATP-dependent carboligase
MRIFVYEHLTAASIGHSPGDPEHSLYREGQAMRDAAVVDFGRIAGVHVLTTPEEFSLSDSQFEDLCRTSDWTLLIAPETEHCLLSLAERAERVGGRLLGHSSDAIRLTSDKFALFEHWRSRGVPTPATTERAPTACEAFPVVWKPRDGAGSMFTFALHSARDVARAHALVAAAKHEGPMILQEYVAGLPTSVACLCGPDGSMPLLPARQVLSRDDRLKYEGGELPLRGDLSERAVRLAQRAVACVPGLRGYLGVDLVLGNAADGSRDYAIEINPRLTTSYIGLRRLASSNLAELMLQAAWGQPMAPLAWSTQSVQFDARGEVSMIN